MIRKINILLGVCLALATGYQLLFHAKGVNVECVWIVVAGCLCSGFFVSRARSYVEFPFSTFTAMWFPFTALFVPLVGASLDGNPLIYKLKLPVEALTTAALITLTVTLVHVVYRRLKWTARVKQSLQDHVMGRLSLMTPPSVVQLWLFGGVGSAASMVIFLVLGRSETLGSGLLPQTLQTLRPFAFAPFILPFMALFGNEVRPSRSQLLLLVPYGIMTVAIAMMANSRAVFAVPVITIILAGLFMVTTGRVNPRTLSWPRLTIVLVIAFIGAGILMDLATAMRVARGKRGYLSGSELVGETITLFFDKEQLRNYWASNRALGGTAGSWDEDYIQNEFLQRLSSLKFIDLSLYFTRSFGESERERLQDFSNDRLISTLPNPVIRFLGIHVQKFRVMNMSFGDFLYGARSDTFDAFRTGSFAVVDRLIHGKWFYLVLAGIALFYFFVADCFTRRVDGDKSPNASRRESVVFMPVSIIFSYALVQSLYQESLASTLGLYTRTLPQILVLYFLLFHATRFVSDLMPHFGEQRRRPRRIPLLIAG